MEWWVRGPQQWTTMLLLPAPDLWPSMQVQRGNTTKRATEQIIIPNKIMNHNSDGGELRCLFLDD